MASRLRISQCKILFYIFYTINCVVYIVEFEIEVLISKTAPDSLMRVGSRTHLNLRDIIGTPLEGPYFCFQIQF